MKKGNLKFLGTLRKWGFTIRYVYGMVLLYMPWYRSIHLQVVYEDRHVMLVISLYCSSS